MAYGEHHLISAFRIYEDPFILMLSRPHCPILQRNKGVSDYYDKIGFDSRVDHLYDSGICLIGSPAGLGNGLSILGHFAGLVLVSGVS